MDVDDTARAGLGVVATANVGYAEDDVAGVVVRC